MAGNKTLRSLSKLISFFGWLVVIASVIAILIAFNALSNDEYAGLAFLSAAIPGIATGLVIVATGQFFSSFAQMSADVRKLVALNKRTVEHLESSAQERGPSPATRGDLTDDDLPF